MIVNDLELVRAVLAPRVDLPDPHRDFKRWCDFAVSLAKDKWKSMLFEVQEHMLRLQIPTGETPQPPPL